MCFPYSRAKAQTFVFFAVSLSTVFLLCGLGLDMGLWFLDRTRLSRACDAAAITGAANFGKTTGTNAANGRAIVATKMRNVAVANYYGLKDISKVPVIGISTNNLGGTNYHYYYTASGDTNEAGYHVTIATGLAGQVTRAQSEAWSKTRTIFMGFTGASQLMKLNTKGTAEAKRRPRLIVLVLDRSGSMVNNGGSTNLPPAVTNFLGLMKDDAENNEVGIVSFSSFGRVEMFPTTNFWLKGTNRMYRTDTSSVNTTGMKFGGNTGADEGMRLAMELMRTNQGYNDPQTYKFIVFMTDGQFNITRTLLAAPPWRNTMYMPTGVTTTNRTNSYLPAAGNGFYAGLTNALAKSANPGVERIFPQNISPDGNNRYPKWVVLTMFPGWAAYKYYTNSGSITYLSTNWSQSTNYYTNAVSLDPGQVLELVAPGYVIDGNFIPGTRSGSVANPTYISKCGYNIFKASDGDESAGGVYPDGIYYDFYDSSGSRTNIAMTGSGPAGELFYRKSGSSTQEIKNLSDWHQDIPSYVTNFYTNAMTNWTSTNLYASVRYYAASYTGFLKPHHWIEEDHIIRNMPSNNSLGGRLYSNSGATTNYTNINTMTINGGPTHYYDFRVGGWSNFKTWSTDANTMATPMCNWKVLTYCDMARRADVTIYTVGFDGADANILRAMANDRSATNYTSGLPTGKFYDCNTPQDIVTNFTQIAQQILAFLSK